MHWLALEGDDEWQFFSPGSKMLGGIQLSNEKQNRQNVNGVRKQ